MKKFIARTSACSTDTCEARFDDVNQAIKWLGDCKNTMGTVYRWCTGNAVYQIERGKLNFDRRMEREKT